MPYVTPAHAASGWRGFDLSGFLLARLSMFSLHGSDNKEHEPFYHLTLDPLLEREEIRSPLLPGEGWGGSRPGTFFTEWTGHMGDTWQSIGQEVADAVEGDPGDGRAVKVHCRVSRGRVDHERAVAGVRH